MINKAIETPINALLASAEKIRREHFGNRFDMCAIVNARCGKCAMDCKFCPQSLHHNTDVQSFPLLSHEKLICQIENSGVIPKSVWTAAAPAPYAPVVAGLPTFNSGISKQLQFNRVGIVTSGQALCGDELSRLLDVIAEIKEKSISVCASLGTLDIDSLKRLKKAGLSRYHHNLETSEAFYSQICTTQKWRARFNTVLAAKEAGLEVCSGGIFGLGESWQDRIDLAFTLKNLNVDCVPINFLNPQKGTPLTEQALLSEEEALRIIAIFRHILPKTSLRICGGRPVVIKTQHKIFEAGADAIMTGNYLTTYGIDSETDRKMIEKLA